MMIATKIANESYAAIKRLFEIDHPSVCNTCIAVTANKSSKISVRVYRYMCVGIYNTRHNVFIAVINYFNIFRHLSSQVGKISNFVDSSVSNKKP